MRPAIPVWASHKQACISIWEDKHSIICNNRKEDSLKDSKIGLGHSRGRTSSSTRKESIVMTIVMTFGRVMNFDAGRRKRRSMSIEWML